MKHMLLEYLAKTNFVEVIANLIIAVFQALLIAFLAKVVFDKVILKNRIDYFKLIYTQVKQSSVSLSQYMREYYEWRYAYIMGTSYPQYLIGKPEWLPARSDKGFHILDDDFNNYLKTEEIEPEKRVGDGKQLRFFPKKKLSLVDNAQLYLDIRIFNNSTYGLQEIGFDANNHLVLKISRGEYYDFYNSCMNIEFETAYEFIRYSRKRPSWRSIRRKIDIFKNQNRFVAIGVNTLTIVRSRESVFFLVHKRSSQVSESMNIFCTVPSGSFQPCSSQAYTIIENIKREFSEELLGHDEFSEVSSKDDKLKDVFPDKSLFFKFLGMGYNPLTTHFEILTALIIDWDDSEEAFRKNIQPNKEGEISYRKFTPEDLQLFEMSNSSAFCLKETCRILRMRIGQDRKWTSSESFNCQTF